MVGGMRSVMTPSVNGTGTPHCHKTTMMHMSFFWGTNSEILFLGWPGSDSGMYVLALVFVFALSMLVEWLSHSTLVPEGSDHVVAGLVETVIHVLRVGLGYMVMLAVMSFNVGVLLVAVAGHGVGFSLFGIRVFKKEDMKHIPLVSC